jgi:YegS/Rv2252/BmrU family lipid kinase
MCAVVSSANRRGVAAITASLRRRLTDLVALDIHVVGSSDEATDAARKAAAFADVVAAVGGDGTVADVATGIFGSRAVLAIVPTGSTNITARSLGIPRQPEAAIALLVRSHVRRTIDVGRSEERSFLHIAGAGFDAEVFRGADPRRKRRLGWIAYLPAAAAALRLPPSRVRIMADDMHVEATSSLVLVANGGSAIAPQFRIYPGIDVDDGWLDVLVFTAATAAEIARTLGYAGRQQLDRSPHVSRHRARRVHIEAEPELSIQLDGDPRGTTPREFHLVPGGMQVITPTS